MEDGTYQLDKSVCQQYKIIPYRWIYNNYGCVSCLQRHLTCGVKVNLFDGIISLFVAR